MADQVGNTIGPYQITEPLGVGGMGEVYKAYHTGLEVFRSIKFIRHELSLASDFRARFQNEARSVARLRHPNIVQVHDFGEYDGRFYMVMEYVDGQSLKAVIANHEPMAIDAAVALVKEIAGALDHAHQRGLIHRDIKPDNIMLDAHHRAVLMDFGIARLIIGDGNLTATGMGIGTPTYMAPEQLKALKVGPYTDVYSLSIVLFELLTGRAPFQADTPLAVLLKSLNDPMPAPRTLNPKISDELEAVILKGTAREAHQRYQTAAEFMHALDEVTRVPGQSPQANASPARFDAEPGGITLKVQPLRSTETSSLSLRWGLIVMVLAIAIAFAGSWWSSTSMQAASDAMLPESDSAQSSVTTSEELKSIAVLPFVDMSEGKDQEYFADGMATEILSLLAELPGLRVIGRTSSFQFKGQPADLRNIGSVLGVTYLLEGTVRRSGNRVRVDAQLVTAEDGIQVWSGNVERTMQDVLSLQREIASGMARTLKITVSEGDLPTVNAVDVEVYDLFLRGIYSFERYDEQGFKEAEVFFLTALDREPTFIRASEYLAWVYFMQANWTYTEPKVGYEKARLAAEKFLENNPESENGHALLARINTDYHWNWDAARREAELAIAIAPRWYVGHYALGALERTLGDLDGAERAFRTALSYDPLNPDTITELGRVLSGSGRVEEALMAYRRALEISPTIGAGHLQVAEALVALGDLDGALSEAQLETEEIWRLKVLSIIYHALGREPDSEATLSQLVQGHGTRSGYQIAQVYAFRGDAQEAVQWLERACDQKDVELIYMKSSFMFRKIESDPGYVAFLQKMKIPT